MNANELAEEVEMWGRDLLALNMKGGIPVIEGARLIRQQAKELTEAGHMIGVLREQLQEEIQARAEDDKPVAWRIKSKNGEWLYYDEPLVGTEPLYTHSVKELNQNDA